MQALKVFENDPSKCPLEICVKAFYLRYSRRFITNCLLSNAILNDDDSTVNFRACKAEFDKEDPEIIEAYLRAAYHGFVLLTGTKYDFLH
jgi:hypothetical protein